MIKFIGRGERWDCVDNIKGVHRKISSRITVSKDNGCAPENEVFQRAANNDRGEHFGVAYLINLNKDAVMVVGREDMMRPKKFESYLTGSPIITISALVNIQRPPDNFEACHFEPPVALLDVSDTEGRLRYIDGCRDSLLSPPVRKGDPCFNLLQFPKNTKQTVHTHPSVRMGVVVKGRGNCFDDRGGRADLDECSVFVIPANSSHAFSTGDEEMVFLIYSAVSDFRADG